MVGFYFCMTKARIINMYVIIISSFIWFRKDFKPRFKGTVVAILLHNQSPYKRIYFANMFPLKIAVFDIMRKWIFFTICGNFTQSGMTFAKSVVTFLIISDDFCTICIDFLHNLQWLLFIFWIILWIFYNALRSLNLRIAKKLDKKTFL